MFSFGLERDNTLRVLGISKHISGMTARFIGGQALEKILTENSLLRANAREFNGVTILELELDSALLNTFFSFAEDVFWTL